MKTLLLVCAVTLAAGGATGGGLDQSGQPITLIFEQGDYAEVGFGIWLPEITGTDPAGQTSGNVYNSVTDFGGGIKKQITPSLSAALIVDQPYGVFVNYELDYPGGAFPFAGTKAQPNSLGVTGLVRYRVDERFSVHGGLRAERFGGAVTLAGSAFDAVGLGGYKWTGDPDWGLGYVIGGAYERPEIALRVALTYGSEIRHSLKAEENFFGASVTDITMPQSVNLDFQTGVAPGTLLYGSVRWVNWAGWNVSPKGFTAATGAPLVEFTDNAFTYRLGIGRQITDALALAVEVSHETAKDTMMSPLDPYDGYTAVAIGATYATRTGVRLSGGVAYDILGDADVASPTGEISRFRNNHAISARLRIGIAF